MKGCQWPTKAFVIFFTFNCFQTVNIQNSKHVINFCLTLKGALLGLKQSLATESPSKMMKNGFYFTWKALSVFKIFKFLLDFLVMYKNGLIKKIRLIPYFMTPIVIHILPNISRSKGKQTMKLKLSISLDK